MRLWQIASCNRLVVNRLTKTKPWHHGLLSSLCPNSTYTLSAMNITYRQAQSDINQITFWAFHCSTDNDTHSACDSFREWVWVWHWSDITLYDWYKRQHTHTHTHPFNGPFSGTTQVSRYQIYKKPIWILLKQETVSGSGISWDIYKSANHSRQITTPAPHRSVYLQALPVAQPTASKHWRQKKTTWCWFHRHVDTLMNWQQGFLCRCTAPLPTVANKTKAAAIDHYFSLPTENIFVPVSLGTPGYRQYIDSFVMCHQSASRCTI